MTRDPDALQAIWHTLLIAVAITIIQNGVGLLLALGVNTHDQVAQRAAGLPVRAGGGHPDRDRLPVAQPARPGRCGQQPAGCGRAGLVAAGLAGRPASWRSGRSSAVIVWQFGGYSMVIFLAGLQSVPKEIYEAAAIDGGGPVRRFWSVIRPLLAPAFTINLMLSIIGGIKLFDQVYALTGGGPGHATDTISTLIYKDAFTLGEFGYSIALAVVLTVIVAVVSTGQYLCPGAEREGGLMNRYRWRTFGLELVMVARRRWSIGFPVYVLVNLAVRRAVGHVVADPRRPPRRRWTTSPRPGSRAALGGALINSVLVTVVSVVDRAGRLVAGRLSAGPGHRPLVARDVPADHAGPDAAVPARRAAAVPDDAGPGSARLARGR